MVRGMTAIVVVGAFLAAACLGASATTSPGRSHRQVFAFQGRSGWHTATTGTGVTAPEAPTAWATTLPARAASAEDPWTTLIPRLRGHPRRVAVVAIIYGRTRTTTSRRLLREFPRRHLPLRLRDAAVQHAWEGMPGRNVVQLVLTARIHGYLVQLNGYFGTQHPTARQIATAQRELDRLTIPPRPHP
jgi:hypothetical protein